MPIFDVSSSAFMSTNRGKTSVLLVQSPTFWVMTSLNRLEGFRHFTTTGRKTHSQMFMWVIEMPELSKLPPTLRKTFFPCLYTDYGQSKREMRAISAFKYFFPASSLEKNHQAHFITPYASMKQKVAKLWAKPKYWLKPKDIRLNK